jgi:hypothetical protein
MGGRTKSSVSSTALKKASEAHWVDIERLKVHMLLRDITTRKKGNIRRYRAEMIIEALIQMMT